MLGNKRVACFANMLKSRCKMFATYIYSFNFFMCVFGNMHCY